MLAKLTKGGLWWLCNMSACWKNMFPRIPFPVMSGHSGEQERFLLEIWMMKVKQQLFCSSHTAYHIT